MGHSKAEKDKSHRRIVKTAAARFRERGVDGIGLADLMKEADLTHGGFYGHFDSREELVAEAVECALRDGGEAVAAGASAQQPPPPGLKLLLGAHLSPRHPERLAARPPVPTHADALPANDPAAPSPHHH